MQFAYAAPMLLSILLNGGVAFALADDAQSNPLGKVFELMEQLKTKIVAEGEAEAKAFTEFFEWCDETSANLQNQIKTGGSLKEKLEAKIAELISNIAVGDSKIEGLAAAVSQAEAELADATSIRNTEKADFDASEKELLEAVNALDRAISIISTEMSKNPAALAQIDTTSMSNLVQSMTAVVDAAGFSTSDRQKLMALVQSKQTEEDNELSPPSTANYKSHSSNIVDMLEDLKEKAEGKLGDARKAETSAKHNFQMMKQSLEDQMAADNKDLTAEKAAKAEAEEGKAVAEGDLSVNVKDLQTATSNLATTHSDCMTTAADHEATVAARNQELKVIAEAEKILKESTSGAEGQAYSFLQDAAVSHSMSQIRSRVDLVNSEVIALVKKLAKEQHSATLAQLASRISALVKYGGRDGEDPFAKIKSLLSDMIVKLEKEAEHDASEKVYCDEELALTEAKNQELDAAIAKLTSKIDRRAAKSAGLKEQIRETQSDLAALSKELAELDKVRREENANYKVAKAELEEGLMGVRKALGVLRDYYGGSAAMLQEDQPAKPVMHSKSTDAGGSIINILEVCESDFATSLAKEEAQEADAAADHEKTTKDDRLTKAAKEQDIKYLTAEAAALDKEISEYSSDRDTTNAEGSALREYYAQIKERCIARPETYEERKARRDAEIEGLKEALATLDAQSFMQRRNRMRGAHRMQKLQ